MLLEVDTTVRCCHDPWPALYIAVQNLFDGSGTLVQSMTLQEKQDCLKGLKVAILATVARIQGPCDKGCQVAPMQAPTLSATLVPPGTHGLRRHCWDSELT